MAKSKSVKTLIKDLEANELKDVIIELCKLSTKNKQFLELYLLGSADVNPAAIVEEARKQIYAHLYGRSLPKLDLRGGRRVVNEYCKVLKEYPRYAAEVRFCYVEIGTAITNEFGDMYEGFYNSMGSMYASFCELIKEHPEIHEHFRIKIEDLLNETANIGWGYGDELREYTSELDLYLSHHDL